MACEGNFKPEDFLDCEVLWYAETLGLTLSIYLEEGDDNGETAQKCLGRGGWARVWYLLAYERRLAPA
jgi:hypothetical protein